MKNYEATGKTYEEALENGLSALSATISDVDITVLEEGSKGLFGLFGSRPYKVRPLFSLWICAGYNAAFAVYWVTSNLIHLVQNQIINWHLDRSERRAAVNTDAADVKGSIK